MATHKALFLLEKQGSLAIRDVSTPKPGPGELLVEVKATGLNPIDWKIQAYGLFFTEYPATLGIDSAGIVKEVGEGVTRFVVGDQVLHVGYFNNRQATFQQYSVVPAELTAKLPSNLTFEQGSSIPIALETAAFGLYSSELPTGPCGAGLTPPWQAGGRGKYAGQPIVILGGSSAVGQQVIQLAKLSGFSPIITTASPRNADLLKSLGATHVVDRSLPLAPAVKAITSEPIKIVYDAISLKVTQQAGYDVVTPGGTLIIVLSLEVDKNAIDSSKSIAQVFGRANYESSVFKVLTALLESGEIKPNNVEVLPDGLAGIPDGLERLKADKVSATKLVALPWA
ncbi:GroES-like protein [Irpex rosettiformis]|uniref:GroES-like protein n=1 Tax=Irpex rosettiformis TaxID=378272 RepID=A0ACB8UAR6_9APHY|nr:GroES-like protein [Irpex rosettiformis]